MRILFDTNVLFAAFATQGLCNLLFMHCLEQQSIITTDYILSELERRLRSKIKLPPAEMRRVLRYLRAGLVLVDAVEVDARVCRDPNDAAILGAALGGAAQILVTGDKDLLVLKTFENIPIVSPRTLYERLQVLPDE